MTEEDYKSDLIFKKDVGLTVSYLVSIVENWEKIYCIIVHYTLLYLVVLSHYVFC